MDARDLQALDSAPGDAAHGLHRQLLHVATACDPRRVLHGGVNCIDAPLAAEVDARHLHLDLGLLTHDLLLHFQCGTDHLVVAAPSNEVDNVFMPRIHVDFLYARSPVAPNTTSASARWPGSSQVV